MKYKPFQAFLIVLLAAGIISACQSQTEKVTATILPTQAVSTPTGQVRQTTSPEKTKIRPSATASPTAIGGANMSALRGEVITFWHPWQGDLADRVLKAVDVFNRTNEWGLTVEVTSFYNNSALDDALNRVVSSQEDGSTSAIQQTLSAGNGVGMTKGQLPDLVAAAPDQLARLAFGSPPVLVDLTSYIQDPVNGITEEVINSYVLEYWRQDRSDNIQFGLPALRSARVLFYNQSWAKDLGFNSPPKTPEDFKKQACAAAFANNTAKILDLYGTGGWRVDNDPLTTLSWIAAFGADPIPQEEGQPYHFRGEKAQDAVDFLQGLVSDGCAWLGNDMQPYETFARRKALFYSGTLADMTMQSRWQEQLNNDDQWTVLPFPGSDGKGVAFSSGYSYGIFDSTPEKQMGAWLFIRWLSQPEVAFDLIESFPSIPVSKSISEKINSEGMNSQWEQILLMADNLRAAPSLPSWGQARRPLEDAGWQIYHLPSDNLTQILPQLDQTIADLLQRE